MGLIQRLGGALLGVALFIAALVFTSVLLALLAVVALVAWAWLWWQSRQLRRTAGRAEGSVIEGEYRVEREVRRVDGPDLPPRP